MLYLHIGRQKTGTTAIQRFFDQNRERLKEIGVCYPLAVPFGGIAHHGLAHALDRKDGRAKTPKSLHPRFLEAFQKSIRGARDIIVSSEGFGKLDPAWITDFFPPK